MKKVFDIVRLTIENQHDFELNAHINLISEYVPFALKKVIIPPKSKVVVPISLKDINLNKSARIILVGEPTEEINLPFQLRIIKKTNRFPVKN